MTESEMKQMIFSVLSGEKWEHKCSSPETICNDCGFPCSPHQAAHKDEWVPYKLGDEVLSSHTYRKVKDWYVLKHEEDGFIVKQKLSEDYFAECIPFSDKTDTTEFQLWWFKGSKEDCEKWVADKCNSHWIDEKFPLGDVIDDMHQEGEKERLGATQFAKELIKRSRQQMMNDLIRIADLQVIIKDMGVNID